jgi:hypothetical protein
MACQEASILSRQNASIMPRQTRIGKFTSRNHRDGFSRSRCVGTGRVAAGDVPRSPAPQPAARNSSHFGGRAGPRPTSRRGRCRAAGARALATGDQRRRRVPRARWRNRRREVRRVADRCPVLRSRPARSRSDILGGEFFGRLPVPRGSLSLSLSLIWLLLQINNGFANGRLHEWPKAIGRCGQAVGVSSRAGALARHAQPRAHPAGTGSLRGADGHPRKKSTTSLTAP